MNILPVIWLCILVNNQTVHIRTEIKEALWSRPKKNFGLGLQWVVTKQFIAIQFTPKLHVMTLDWRLDWHSQHLPLPCPVRWVAWAVGVCTQLLSPHKFFWTFYFRGLLLGLCFR